MKKRKKARHILANSARGDYNKQRAKNCGIKLPIGNSEGKCG